MHIRGEEALALEKAKTICLEQTVELEADLVPTDLQDWIVGRLEQFTPVQAYYLSVSHDLTDESE